MNNLTPQSKNSACSSQENGLNLKNDENVEHLQSIIRDVSLGKVSGQIRGADFSVNEVEDLNRTVLGQWMVMIIISGKNLKIMFKCHFNSKDGLGYLSEKTNKPAGDSAQNQVFDLLKEYCNLVGGGIKDCLGSENSLMGLSIPLISRGFDEIFFSDRSIRSEKLRNRDVWKISKDQINIYCSSEIQVVDGSGLQDLQDFVSNNEDDGELDFL